MNLEKTLKNQSNKNSERVLEWSKSKRRFPGWGWQDVSSVQAETDCNQTAGREHS